MTTPIRHGGPEMDRPDTGIAMGADHRKEPGLQADDPWVHRAAKMRCRCCMWCVPKISNAMIKESIIGRCRRHAPTMAGYPVIYMDDWCGDHKLNEDMV